MNPLKNIEFIYLFWRICNFIGDELALDDDQSYLDDIGKLPDAPITKPDAIANRTNKVSVHFSYGPIL